MTNNPTVFPINFDLLNDNAENIIFISDDVNGQNLSLEIQNSSAITTTTKSLTGQASIVNHHFELVFRPGTLSNNPTDIGLNSTEYEMFINKDPSGKIIANADGTHSLYFKAKSTLTILADQISVIALTKVNAEIGSGTRGTKVLLKYKNLLHADNENTFSGNKERHMNIINHQGEKQIPLFVGFSGSNIVLNDDNHPNTLKLRITNTARKDTPINADANSRIVISFDAGPAKDIWTLSTANKLNGIQINATYPDNSTAELTSPTGSNEWTLPFKALAKGEVIDLIISKIFTGHPIGHSSVHVHYENIPGYWDGELTSVIEKSPLVTHGDKVGIGIAEPDPAAKLQIINKNEGSGGGAVIIGPTNQSNLRLGYNTGYSWIQSHDSKPLAINNLGSNVGIGTNNPQDTLQISNFKPSDQYITVTTGGGNKHRAGLKLWAWKKDWGFIIEHDERYHDPTKNPQGNNGLNFLLREEKSGKVKDKSLLLIDRSGKVGIGNPTPKDQLDIGTYSDRKSTYLSIKTAGGSAHKTGIRLKHYSDKVGWTLESDDTDRDFHILRHYNVLKGKEALSIKGSSGNVGVGSPDPVAKLHVLNKNQNANGNTFILGPTNKSNLRMGYNTNYSWVQSHGSKPLAINPLGNNVGIGTTNPQEMLHVKGNAHITGDLRLEGNIYKKGGDWWHLPLEIPPIPRIHPAPPPANVTDALWRRTSDGRLKHKVLQIDQALTKICNLRGVTFEWNKAGLSYLTRTIETHISAGPGATKEANRRAQESARKEAYEALSGKDIGLIAQDVEKVMPELVDTDETGYKSLRYDLVTALLVEAVKEQQQTIQSLDEKIEILRDENSQLKTKIDILNQKDAQYQNIFSKMNERIEALEMQEA